MSNSNVNKLKSLIKNYTPLINRLSIASVVAVLTLGISFGAQAVPVQYPLFIANPVKPIMMLNMSKDHQLFYKLYDDYSDIVDMRAHVPNSSSASSGSSSSSAAITNPNYGKSGSDGVADRTYIHQYRYYGYFDSDKCYTYANSLYTPSRFVDSATRYCNYGGVTNEWSGNLLNWASMTRLDAVRKILYGGKRAVDTEEDTVLERAFLPEDAHAFAKYYNGTDITRLTPFTTATGGVDAETSGITFCNATSPADATRTTTDAKGKVISTLKSQEVSANPNIHPLLKVAKGNFSLWGSNEGYQCRWDNGTNDNTADTGIKAYASSPKFASDKLLDGDYSVRVKVCVPTLMNETNEEGCKRYDSGYSKPIGLLQEYGEKDTIHFGLLTGSYGKNKSGGALRKNVGTMKDEIDLTTGQFTNPYKNPSNQSLGRKDSIIRTLNALTIYGYDYSSGQYNSADSCDWGLSSFDNGKCTNWGNPQSEIYLESLRYLAGQSAEFAVDDSAKVTGFSTATWTKPVGANNYCAPLNVLQFNASTSSYDVDELGKATELDIGVLDTLVNHIGTAESISGNYFVGVTGTGTGEADELCTPKAIGNLSAVMGTCPDAPRLRGGYHIAGLAYGARKSGIKIKDLGASVNGKAIDNTPSVHTYAVALAPAVPKVEIPVPGDVTGTKRVTILPACRNSKTDPNANCAIVDFKIIAQDHTSSPYTGSMYVNWEDSEQGGDYDQDMWGLIKYSVTSNNVNVQTQVFAQATDHALGFGYVIGGTSNDGFKVQSGINNFLYGTHCTTSSRCTCTGTGNNGDWVGGWKGSCVNPNRAWKSQDFAVAATANVKLLEQPLYYAAKWGGYANDNATDEQIRTSGAPTYYYATDPRKLAESLRNAFNSIAEREGSSSGVATNSTSLNGSSYLYQAVFNSDNWTGALDAFAFDSNGRLVRTLDAKGNLVPAVSTDNVNVQPSPSTRTIYTYDPEAGTVDFRWASLSQTQKDAFWASTDPVGDYTNAEKRFNWSRGDATNEVTPTAAGIDRLRSRTIGSSRNIYGDIVNSTPVYIADTNYRYHKLSNGGSSYAAYLATKAGRTTKVAVGANDGMLHVLNAKTLQEIYAYVPNLVYPKLRNLSAQNYGRSTNPHQYLVDGPLTVSDVFDGTNWRTIVVGTLGGGGRGVFALDVTSDADPKVLFEISDADFPELGYVLGKPIIAPLQNGRWGVIFGNGDSSGRLANPAASITAVATQSHLFVVDIFNATGNTKIISTGAGKGLSAPAVLPDEKGVAKTVYAGDLNGQMWKFDLSSANEGIWKKDYLLFHAKTADSTPKEQPITAAPTLGINSFKGGRVAVYFGTGKYFEDGDHIVSSGNPYHSFYAITDMGNTVTKSQLAEKQLEFFTINGKNSRRLQASTVDWTTKSGWFVNFGLANEERVITKPLLIADRLVFATIIPSSSSCDYGGTSWILEIPAVGNPPGTYQVLKDPPEEGVMTLAAIGVGVTKDALTLLIGRSDGNPDDEAGNQPIKSTGRQSWRELD
jgi:type IV pilus assembly protein PilY1